MSLITLTTSIGSGAMGIARRVAENLQMTLYDDNRLQKEATEMGISSQDLKGFDQKAPGLFNRLLRRRPEVYLELMAAVIYEVARRGDGIIIGQGSPYFLKDFGCALHLRVHASESFRIHRIMKKMETSQDEAKKMISKRDDEVRGFLQFSFQMDWDDLSLYDLVINADKIGLDAAADMIIYLSQNQHIQACSMTALESMEKLSLLKKVEAAIIKANINPQELDIEVPEKGVVKLTGLINPMRTVAGVTEIVKSVSGVTKVVCKAERHPLPGL